ncbi:MAG TPA: glycosyltransferase family 4 protein [Bryobacteraceae bacterium]|nr:glycosyltransferase family 4 protein [Bryobacteraceae bacterium]
MKAFQFLCGRAWGGACAVVLTVTRAMIARGDEVWVLSFDDETDRRFSEAGAHLVRPPFWFQAINPTDVLLLGYFWRFCRKQQFDLVITHTSKGGFLGRVAARLAGVPHIVHHAHGFSFNRPLSPRATQFFVALERFAAGMGDLIVAVNEQQRRLAVELGVEKPEKTCTIPNGIDLRPFAEADGESIRKRLGFDSSAFLIGAVGRLAPQKGFAHLIHAIPDVLRSAPSAQFIVAGDGELRDELLREADRAGVTRHIHFIGFQRDVVGLLAALDVFVQPSLWEGLSISLIEALAAGKPIVATDIEGNREVVDDGMTALIVPPADPGALSRALISLAEDRDRARALGSNARNAAHARFSESRMVADTIRTYDRLMAGARRPASKEALFNGSAHGVGPL